MGGQPGLSLIGLSAAQIEAALQNDWSIISSPGAEQGWSVVTRGSRTVLRCTIADDTPRGGNWHMRQLGSNGAGKTGAVLRYEVYLPHPGGYVNNAAGARSRGCGVPLPA